TTGIEWINEGLVSLLQIGPPIVLIIVIALIAWWVVNWKIALFSLIGLGLVDNLGYWPETIETITLIFMSVLISFINGVRLGIWMTQKHTVQSVISPILAFMQTIRAFVYLIPTDVFFGLCVVPGFIATIIYSVLHTVRLKNLSIRQLAEEN